jgi:Protein of unknown function (DUF2612)
MSQFTTDHYLSLITQFHAHRENFSATVQALTSAPVGIMGVLEDMPRAFDLDEAIGVQLDATGRWIGRDRFVPYPLDTNWFTFDDGARGLDLGVWSGPYDADYGVYRLDDTLYRKLLYAQVAANYWDGTTESAENILVTFYSGGDVDPGGGGTTGNEDDLTRYLMGMYSDSAELGPPDSSDSLTWYLMGYHLDTLSSSPVSSPGSRFFLEARGDKSATFAVAGKFPPPLTLAMMSWPAINLRAAGELMRYMVVSIDDSSFFGFDVVNQNVKGFDSGVWGVHPLSVMYAGLPGVLDFSNPAYSGLIGATT